MNVRYRPSSLVSAMSDSNVARKSALLSISDKACQLYRMLLKSMETISRSAVGRSSAPCFVPTCALDRFRRHAVPRHGAASHEIWWRYLNDGMIDVRGPRQYVPFCQLPSEPPA